MITPHVVTYAAQECAWQYSGELSVGWMIDAWWYAYRRRDQSIQFEDVVALGQFVEPNVNNGLRTVNVRVGSSVKLNWRLVDSALETLLVNQPKLADAAEIDVTEWFRQYEEIHPFRDGNGRTGSLLYNWLRGSLGDPVHVPNLWNDPRRDTV